MKQRRLITLIFCVLCNFYAGCSSARVDQVFLNSHRIAGYTATATQLTSDLFDEKVITREQALTVARALQRMNSQHAQIFEVLKVALVGNELSLSVEQRAKIEALTMGLEASLPDAAALPSPAALRLTPVLGALEAAIKQLAKDALGRSTAAAKVLLSPAQLLRLRAQAAELASASRELEALVN